MRVLYLSSKVPVLLFLVLWRRRKGTTFWDDSFHGKQKNLDRERKGEKGFYDKTSVRHFWSHSASSSKSTRRKVDIEPDIIHDIKILRI